MAEFALFLAGTGFGVVMMLPAVLVAWLLGAGVIAFVPVATTAKPETPEQRRERMRAEYQEAAGRG